MHEPAHLRRRPCPTTSPVMGGLGLLRRRRELAPAPRNRARHRGAIASVEPRRNRRPCGAAPPGSAVDVPTARNGASARAGERGTRRAAAQARSAIRLYPEMHSAHACMTGRRFSSRSSRAYAATVAEPSTCASANSESSSSTSCCRAQPLKLERNPCVTSWIHPTRPVEGADHWPNPARKHQDKADRKSGIRAGQMSQNVVESMG